MADAEISPWVPECTEGCRKINLQLRALEPERDRTGQVNNKQSEQWYKPQYASHNNGINHNSLSKDNETWGAIKGRIT